MSTTTATKVRNPFAGARKMKPTLKHRPAIWEAILGTVYASNGIEVRYFDYRWDEARAFAGVDQPGADPRLARAKRGNGNTLRAGQMAVYVRVA